MLTMRNLLLSAFIAAGALSGNAESQKVGMGIYRDDLPPDSSGKARRIVKAMPLVSASFQGPVPTSDWWSSLVWPEQSPHSLPMFPHPLAMQAHAEGLGIGYNPVPSVTSHMKDGKPFLIGSDYRYRYRQSLLVGLQSMKTEATVLDACSDWAVTALWQQGKGELRATFGHGMPFVYFRRKSDKPIVIRFTAAKVNAHNEPVQPLVYEVTGLAGKHSGKPGTIQLSVNAGKIAGIGSKARLVYDFNGDGKTDRVETFALLATDPSAESWEVYSSNKQKLDSNLSHGETQDFKNGSVKLEFWKCFGKGPVALKLAECTVGLPLANGVHHPADGRLTRSAGSGTARTDDDAQAGGAARIFARSGNVAGVSLNGTHFGLFAPSGATWKGPEERADQLVSDLNGKSYLSVAVLPDDSPETLAWFRERAYSFITDTRIDYRYNPDKASVRSTFTASIEVMEGSKKEAALALYRHQHLYLTGSTKLEDFSYLGPRGAMRVLGGNSFATELPYLGVLPSLPVANKDDAGLRARLQSSANKVASFTKSDTYWNGKELGKVAELVQIAEQLGETALRDKLLGQLKRRLEDWFDGEAQHFFYYHAPWNTLIGYPDSYASADQLNDHHFHYSYFIKAAATIAQYDPDWAKPENYGGMVDLLVLDCANYDRKDARFPWMRNLDPYAGHSWASGHSAFASGNNQESSSESMNFAGALILWGEATENTEVRDLGIYWHSTEAEAIRQYWFDVDGEVFPQAYRQSCVGMVWGDGGAYGTWWTANPEEIHAINYLPLNGGSMYLGRDPAYVRINLKNLVESNRRFHEIGGFPGDPATFDRWADIILQYRALAAPDSALTQLDALGKNIPREFGETEAHTLQWITALQALGQFDEQTRADHPTALVFDKNGKKHYVVYNAGIKEVPVEFSDGSKFSAGPGLRTFK